MDKGKIGGECSCRRKKVKEKLNKLGKRKRQTLVHNPDEEVWHEPYMHCLRKEFSQVSIPCDSKIELPWKDIALPAIAMKIRANVAANKEMSDVKDPVAFEGEGDKDVKSVEPKESSGKMSLPWKDLLVMETVAPQQNLGGNGAPCNSTLEIPWDDLSLEKPVDIRPIPEEEPCDDDDVEIPWDDILLPSNIVIETRKKKKHPSSRTAATRYSHTASPSCCTKSCCAKTSSRK